MRLAAALVERGPVTATIPMRGNESSHIAASTVRPRRATIPMRGNECSMTGTPVGVFMGYDPHEG